MSSTEGTIDFVDGTYEGKLTDGDLKGRVDVIDRDSSLEVRFYAKEGELWAHVTFRGEARVDYVIGHYTLEGPDSNTIEGVTVDGNELWCDYDVDVTKLSVYGRFEDGRRRLMLDVEALGTLWLDRE